MHSRKCAETAHHDNDVESHGPTAWLGFLLNTLGDRLRTKTCDALRPWGLAARDLGALESVAAFGPLSQIELGRIIRMDRTSVVQLVDRLEKAGWMTRQVNPEDRRVHALQLTREGAAKLVKVRSIAAEAEREVAAELSADELAQLKRTLQRLL